MSKLQGVITTIQSPTDAVRSLMASLRPLGAKLIIVGDKKGPSDYRLDGTEFLSLDTQLASRFDLARALPVAHYTRKNIGYLHAIADGAECLYETDDDNAPLASWQPRLEHCEALELPARGWTNVYRFFTEQQIWPRGLPLDAINAVPEQAGLAAEFATNVWAPIQQGLADGSPDVDAIWRLVLDAPFQFEQRPSVQLPEGAWCPFNSQSTWWWPAAFPLLYLPSFCSFRMTDIWRSFIAQRCLWAMDTGLVFHAPEVHQDRNEHDLMRDFADEVPGYLINRRIAELLDALRLDRGSDAALANLRRCYVSLCAAGIFPEAELGLVDLWTADLLATGYMK